MKRKKKKKKLLQPNFIATFNYNLPELGRT